MNETPAHNSRVVTPKSPATDGYFLSNGEEAMVTTHGVSGLPYEMLMQHHEKFDIQQRSDGRIVFSYKPRRVESEVEVHPNFGLPCHRHVCYRYAAFPCMQCRFVKYCGESCYYKNGSHHKRLCHTICTIVSNPTSLFWFLELYVIFVQAIRTFHEVGNTARCTFTSPEKIDTQPHTRRTVTEVVSLTVGFAWASRLQQEGIQTHCACSHKI